MEIRIRRAAFSDLPAAKEMYAALVARMDQEGWGVWDETYPRDFVEKDIERGQFYLLLEGDRLAGAFALPPTTTGRGTCPGRSLLPGPLPVPVRHRCGVRRPESGKTSLGLIEELAKSFGAQYLRLYVAHENEPAIALYRKAGFSQLPGEFGEVLEDGTRLFEYAFEKRL